MPLPLLESLRNARGIERRQLRPENLVSMNLTKLDKQRQIPSEVGQVTFTDQISQSMRKHPNSLLEKKQGSMFFIPLLFLSMGQNPMPRHYFLIHEINTCLQASILKNGLFWRLPSGVSSKTESQEWYLFSSRQLCWWRLTTTPYRTPLKIRRDWPYSPASQWAMLNEMKD